MTPPVEPQPVLAVRNLSVRIGHRQIVEGVSFDLQPGQTLGVVGGSGCGKTTLLRAILGLTPASGSVQIAGNDLFALRGAARRRTSRHFQAVFQDPGGSLNPLMTIAQAVAEPLAVHRPEVPRAQRHQLALATLERCGLSAAFAERLPRELSGGQRQRAAIARAVVLRPCVLLCDEPTSALDASVQAQILNLLADLQAAQGLSILLITHDLAVVAHLAHQVAVMDAGRIVEHGPPSSVLTSPQHAVTQRLLATLPPTLAPIAP